MVGSRDAVVFDEIANTDFTDPKALVSIMQGYMQDGKFSRGKKEILAFASVSWSGTSTSRASCRTRSTTTSSSRCPTSSRSKRSSTASMAMCPAGRFRRSTPKLLAQDYGFITDYFCEIMHELRRIDLLGSFAITLRAVIDASSHGLTGRDQRAITKIASGLIKLLYPNGRVTDEELEEAATRRV